MPAQHILSRRLFGVHPLQSIRPEQGLQVRLASQVKSYRQRAILAKTAQPASSGVPSVRLPAMRARVCSVDSWYCVVHDFAGKRSNTDRTACTSAIQYVSTGAKDACASCDVDDSVAKGSSRCYSCKPGFEFGEDGYTCIPCSPGLERPHTQMTCSRCSLGRTLFKHGLLLTLQRGTHAANATSCVLPRRLLLPWRYTFPKNAKTYRRTALLAFRAECRRPWHVHKPQAHSDDFMRRRLLLFERTSPQVSIRIYCPAGVANHIVAKAGTYTDENRTNVTFCEPGYYRKNGIKYNCTGNYFGKSHNLTSDICDGTQPLLVPNDHTECKVTFISRPLSLASF